MKTTIEVLSALSNYCYAQFTLYKFNKGSLKIPKKYREGRLAAINYGSELILYYINEEKRIRHHVAEQIDRQINNYSCLSDGEYKSGLYDGLNDLLKNYKRINL